MGPCAQQGMNDAEWMKVNEKTGRGGGRVEERKEGRKDSVIGVCLFVSGCSAPK